jgi:alpha-glucosidase
MRRLLSLVAALCAFSSFGIDYVTVSSPDRRVQLQLGARENRIYFSVRFRSQPVIEASPLRLTLDGTDLAEGTVIASVERSQTNETYAWRGVHSLATNHYNGAVIQLRHGADPFTLEARAFNDGVAFRQIIPDSGELRVPDEATVFTLPPKSIVWYHNLEGHYEAVHLRKDVADVKGGEWAAPPLTFKLSRAAGYASITEADLRNYSGMAFQADGKGGFKIVLAHDQPPSYPFRLRYTNDIERLSHPAVITGTIESPWRVVMIGRDLNALVNCDIVHNLCPPADSKYFPHGLGADWLKPGRAVWKYLDGGQSTLDGAKEFSRLAGELGFEYNVVEGYWSRWSDEEIRDLVDYSRQRGVRLFFWKHSRALRTPEAREEFFRKLHELGVAGAKIDFFDHEHKEIIDLYQALLEAAAKYQIVVNFHGSDKPTGESRSWPNELTREAVRGLESSRLADRATHDVTLPFTRFLAGPADYTPVHFGQRARNTTWAHQIASAAIFSGPLLTFAAHPATILTNPAVEMMKSLPPVWDQTIVLPDSEIGEVAAFVRRSGNAWFLVVMNGTQPRTLRVALSFLGPGDYAALLVQDDLENPAQVSLQRAAMHRRDRVNISLAAGGGFVGRFSPSQ